MKKERARIIKLVELAYKGDPRVKRQKELEELEKLRKKQEVRDRKEKERKDLEDKERVIQEAKQREIDAKADEERKIKDEKVREAQRRREAVRTLSMLSEERAPGTRYDRFFFEEFTKKIKETAGIEELIETLKAAKDSEFVPEIEKIINQHAN